MSVCVYPYLEYYLVPTTYYLRVHTILHYLKSVLLRDLEYYLLRGTLGNEKIKKWRDEPIKYDSWLV